MSKVKKVAGVTGERNIKGTSGKKAEKEAPKGAKSAAKAPRKRPGTAKQTANKPSRARAAAPMKKTSKTSRTSDTKAKKKTVASRVKRQSSRKTQSKRKGALKIVRGRKVISNAPVVTVAVKELDPLRKCGPNTTVQFLYRVDESVDGRRTAHLVFFDRHGWYCEHGRTCPAVGHAKKHNGRIARVS